MSGAVEKAVCLCRECRPDHSGVHRRFRVKASHRVGASAYCCLCYIAQNERMGRYDLNDLCCHMRTVSREA